MIITAYKHLKGIGIAPHVVSDKVILVVINRFTHYQYIKAYRTTDLEELWTSKLYAAGGTYNDIIYNEDNNIIIIPFHFSKIGTIDSETGKLLSAINLTPEGELWRNKSTLCFINENIILAPIAMYISLLKIEHDGKLTLIKRFKPSNFSLYFYGRTVVKDQYVITYAFDSKASYIVFLNFETGNVDRVVPIGPPHVRAYHSLSPVVIANDNVVLAVNIDDELLVIDATEKEIISRIKIPSKHYLNLTTPFVIDHFIITGGYKELHVVLWDAKSRELKIINKLQLEAIPHGLIKKVREIGDTVEFLVYAPPYLYLVSFDKAKCELSLKDSLVVGFIPYTAPEVYLDKRESRVNAYIVGGDTPAESVLFSIDLSDVTEEINVVNSVKKLQLSYSLDLEQKVLKIYVGDLKVSSFKQ